MGTPIGLLASSAPPISAAPLVRDDAAWHRALFEHSTDLIIVLNADGSRRFVSPSVTRLLGYTEETYLTFPTFALVHPDDLAEVQTGHLDCLAHPGPQAPCRYRVRHADGSWRTMESIRSNLLHDPAVNGMVVVSRDITDAERARRRLHESEAQFRSAFTFAAIGMAIVGLDGRWLTVNHALCTITGYRADELSALSFQDITHPDDLDADLAHVEELLAGRIDSYQMEKRYRRKDGSFVWVLLSVSLVRDEAGRPSQFISQVQEIEARKAAEETLRDSEARFRALLANAADIVLLVDGGGHVRWASPSVERVLGIDPGSLIGRSNTELVHPDDRGLLRRAFVETVRAGGAPHRATLRFRRADASYRSLEFVGACHLDDPAIAGVVINARDVSDREALHERLRREALHDPLTGLPNRAMFDERLRVNLANTRRSGQPTGVLFIDFDGFKRINDTLGHAAGDGLLTAAGRRLMGNVRSGDMAARLGGDEFAVALGPLDHADDAETIALRLAEIFQVPIPIAGAAVQVRASIGWASTIDGLIEPDELLAMADRLMYRVKHGRSDISRSAAPAGAAQRD